MTLGVTLETSNPPLPRDKETALAWGIGKVYNERRTGPTGRPAYPPV